MTNDKTLLSKRLTCKTEYKKIKIKIHIVEKETSTLP